MTSIRALLRTILRVSAAALVLAGGFIHLRLWQQQYKALPAEVPGRWVVRTGFPVNAALALLLALALIAIGFGGFARLRPFVLLGALGLELGSIVVLVITRYHALFGWTEDHDWGTGPKRTIVVEILAAVVLLVVVVFDRESGGDRDRSVGSTA